MRCHHPTRLTRGTYRETDKEEYFCRGGAGLVQRERRDAPPDGKHNWCNTREELQEFDPDLYNLLAEYFPQTNLQISKHKKINEYGHQ